MITPQEGAAFFRAHSTLADRRGVYVFGVRAGGGITPIYVGQTKRSYQRECFTADKANKYNLGLDPYEKGTPILFFLASPQKAGPVNARVIRDLEDFLIQTGKVKNEDLVNRRGANEANWGITGVIRGSGGKPSASARTFKAMMGFSK